MSNENVIHLVEFWSLPKDAVGRDDEPHRVNCESLEQAVQLEARLHAVGWPARAVTERVSVDRHYPTAGNGSASRRRQDSVESVAPLKA